MHSPTAVMEMSAFSDLLQGQMSEADTKSKLVGVHGGSLPYSWELDDLYSLYSTVRRNCVVSVLEFGSGWSTLALTIGLHENKISFGDMYNVRHPNPFRLMSIDASSEWLDQAISRIPEELQEYVVPTPSEVTLVGIQGVYASVFQNVPFFVPDLVYLDGPDPEQVEGTVDGWTSVELHGLPMSADLLRIEPHFWPGTEIITDGRRANARFLETRFHRKWDVWFDPYGDHSHFRLDESPFGPVSAEHNRFRVEQARRLRNKESPVEL